MNTLLTTVWLSLGSAVALAQVPPESFPSTAPRMGSEWQIGYVRETYKLRDWQTSPMLYLANLNGVQTAYTRLTTKNQWRVAVQASLGDLVAPGLGIRPVKFMDEQPEPLWLVPTLYRGRLELEYRRLIRRTGSRTDWLGLGLHETLGYANGLVLSTWALNTAAINVLYQTRFTLGRKHTLLLDASLPVVALVGRMPYSNVVSEPGRSQASSFLSGSRWATLNQFVHPQVGAGYQFNLSSRVAFAAVYSYDWLWYTEPRLIRSADHRGKLSVIYQFQRQYR